MNKEGNIRVTAKSRVTRNKRGAENAKTRFATIALPPNKCRSLRRFSKLPNPRHRARCGVFWAQKSRVQPIPTTFLNRILWPRAIISKICHPRVYAVCGEVLRNARGTGWGAASQYLHRGNPPSATSATKSELALTLSTNYRRPCWHLMTV